MSQKFQIRSTVTQRIPAVLRSNVAIQVMHTARRSFQKATMNILKRTCWTLHLDSLHLTQLSPETFVAKRPFSKALEVPFGSPLR
ncbi:hypothetical protein KEM48_010397 [Puccinia striiformis f. sp. tritici PST-130]|nr:hypothetical protein KEM48_010397 [Puccinia striiformis f. sp. tritici PST-130]